MNLKRLKKWLRRPPKAVRPKPAEDAARDANVPGNRAGVHAHPSDIASKRTPTISRTERKPASPAPMAAEELIPSASVSDRPLSRRGIPILKPDEDLAVHFSDTAANGPQKEQPATTERRSENSTVPSIPRSSEGRVIRNRVGIRRLANDADLRDYFRDTASEAAAPQAPPESERPQRVPGKNVPTDRHGIPRLDDQVDLNQLFGTTIDDNASGDDLGEAMQQSLAHDTRTLMKKKTDGFFPTRRLSLKEKLRRYPPPQVQLDLHGQTALQARQRAESFIHAARADGLFTLRIIVGKGRHSQGGAVLPDVIEDLALALKRQDVVLTYSWEKGIKRKSGSLIVYLATEFH